MTPVTIIFDMFLSLIDDPDLALISQEDSEHLLLNYLRFSTVEFHNCNKDLNIIKDDYKYLINSELTVEEIGILAYSMLLFWISPKIRREENLKQHVGTHDFSKLSNANILLRLNDLQRDTRSEVKRMKNRYQSKNMVGLG